METTKNKLPQDKQIFFDKLSNYLDLKLYFFGSIQRKDYFPKSSDIDVAIFTDSISSTIIKIQNYLNVKRSDFKKFVWRLNTTNEVVTGYKMMYKNLEKDIIAEFSIYDEKYKPFILNEYNLKKDLPFYATYLLIILKFLFYSLSIIPAEWYIAGKRFILTYIINKEEDNFVVLDLKDK